MKKEKHLRNNENFLEQKINIVPLRNMIMVPKIVAPILIGRQSTIDCVEGSLAKNNKIICVPQKPKYSSEKYPSAKKIFRVGTLCNIIQVFRLPDGKLRILAEGLLRVKIDRLSKTKDGFFRAQASKLTHTQNSGLELTAEIRAIKKTFFDYVKIDGNIPLEVFKPLEEMRQPSDFFYYVLANFATSIDKKQKLFEVESINEALNELLKLIHKEIEIFKLEKKIDVNVNSKLNKLQREYYLREQLKEIKKELGIEKKENNDIDELKERLGKLTLSKQVKKMVEEEINKLYRMSPGYQEYTVIYNYLDWIASLPWKKTKIADFSLKQAENILNLDHYGLKKIKDIVLEYLAVIKYVKENRGKILCFVGAPGVGKTSLGKAIAKAMGRKFARLSLGGVRDEAEIRGHRRTYVGAVPGVIINSMKKAGSTNPVIMMDEIDKLSGDFRGDPASALLEVLDPEQNNSFRDHYLDFDYDLSNVTFITTANTLSSIPLPLLDRMEIVTLPGYTLFEKLLISKKHLIRRIEKKFLIQKELKIKFSDEILTTIIKNFTREVGVRSLEKQIEKIYRKIIREILEGKKKRIFSLTKRDLTKYLGVAKFSSSKVNKKDAIGVVTGLAWTMVGGETLQIEISKTKGSGKVKLTGNLGDIMKESAQAAYTYARVNAKKYNIKEDFYKNTDLHLHLPEGAVPKDGPSAGAAITTAIISVLSGRKVASNLAMTGEISLRGDILAIGGLEEKLVAAKQAEITKVIIPFDNKPFLSEFSKEITDGLEILAVKNLREVLKIALK